jgi:putative transposase
VRKADGWHAHIVCELADVPAVPDTDPAVRAALDLGVERLATLHNGTPLENPRFIRRAHAKLRAEQRALSRKRKGSRRRAKQRERVARVHLKLARTRRDFHHKQAFKLAERYRFVAVEDLAVAAMTRSAKGTIELPGRRVRQKAGLNRSILDAGWVQFLALLEAKLQERGGQLVRVKPHGTSQTCSRCEARAKRAIRAQAPMSSVRASAAPRSQRGDKHLQPGMGSARRRGSVRRCQHRSRL